MRSDRDKEEWDIVTAGGNITEFPNLILEYLGVVGVTQTSRNPSAPNLFRREVEKGKNHFS